MEANNFFVMLNHPVCAPLIMTDSQGDGDDIAYFKTYKLAKEAATDNTHHFINDGETKHTETPLAVA